MSGPDLSGYVDVAERIAEFRAKHPHGSLRPVDPSRPFWIEHVPDVGARLVYVAAAFRDPADPCPGIGCAWEPLPGRTPYTRDSELMVAETSAWGRAIVAALAADTRRGIATADEIRNRTPDASARPANAATVTTAAVKAQVLAVLDDDRDAAAHVWTTAGLPARGSITAEQAAHVLDLARRHRLDHLATAAELTTGDLDDLAAAVLDPRAGRPATVADCSPADVERLTVAVAALVDGTARIDYADDGTARIIDGAHR